MSINVLVACEFSGVVREAFNAYHGVHAISCDLLPPEDGRVDYHYQGDVRDILNDGWDVMIAHPTCTYATNAGVRWLISRKEKSGFDWSEKHGVFVNWDRWEKMVESVEFFKTLLATKIPRKAIENPIPHGYALELIGRKYDQIVQPYMFGHLESKQTCLWLDRLPPLQETNNVREQMKKLPKNQSHRVHHAPPSSTRWMDRSRTYSGIAQAMAKQWIPVVLKNG